jgi:hypothetical protein
MHPYSNDGQYLRSGDQVRFEGDEYQVGATSGEQAYLRTIAGGLIPVWADEVDADAPELGDRR